MSDIVTCRLTDDVRQVVLVPAVVIPGVRLKQVVPGGELEGHAGRAPDVCGGPVPRAQQHLQRPVLPGLDILGVVMILQRREIHGHEILRGQLTSQQALPRSAILHSSSGTTSRIGSCK